MAIIADALCIYHVIYLPPLITLTCLSLVYKIYDQCHPIISIIIECDVINLYHITAKMYLAFTLSAQEKSNKIGFIICTFICTAVGNICKLQIILYKKCHE
jgi:hypothetical protein